ncbi:MAG: NAD(P)-binding protein [Planctomycetaceae bacterium]
MRYHTVIIGAGMSGLAAGIRLAYYEKPVCILERHTTIGGLNSFYRLRPQLRCRPSRGHELRRARHTYRPTRQTAETTPPEVGRL